MPEYSQVQIYVRCNEEKFKLIISKYKDVLTTLGFERTYLEKSFDNINWKVEDNGFAYAGCNAHSVKIRFEETDLDLRPSFMGWTSETLPKLKEPWLELSILFETEQIEKDYAIGQLKDEVKKVIWDFMKVLSDNFIETGVYFTDELTDGKPWEAIIGESKDIWSFDAAIIPIDAAGFYTAVPAGFVKTVSDNRIYIVRMDAWGSLSWENGMSLCRETLHHP